MKKEKTGDELFAELASLFFTTRQVIRGHIPTGKKADPNAWQQCEVLRYIAQTQEPTMREVADFLRVKAPTATSLISSLDKVGMIQRTAGTKDKRVVRISLTAQGKREVAAYHKRAAMMMQKTFSKLSRNEITTLAAILRRVRDVHSQ